MHRLPGATKKEVIDNYRGEGNVRPVLGGSPVDKFHFRDRKSDPKAGTLSLDATEIVLKGPNIRTLRVPADR